MSSAPPNEPIEKPLLFEETQWSPPWVYLLLAPAALLAVTIAVQGLLRDRNYLLLLPLLALLLTGNLLCVQTRVDVRDLVVTFGAVFPLYQRRIRLSDIVSAQAVVYDPLSEYGGWGIRGTKGDQCLNARGNEGVRLTLADGSKLLVGSGRAGELEMILQPLS